MRETDAAKAEKIRSILLKVAPMPRRDGVLTFDNANINNISSADFNTTTKLVQFKACLLQLWESDCLSQ